MAMLMMTVKIASRRGRGGDDPLNRVQVLTWDSPSST
jgi:hypothetical protein